MKLWGLMLGGFVLYCIQAVAVYSNMPKDRYFYGFCLLTTMTAGIIWFYIAANQPNKHQVMFLGTVWDFSILAAYYFIPMALYGVKLTPMGAIGLALTVLGMLIIKLGAA